MSRTPKRPASDSFNEIATLRIELCDTDPVIWRQVEAPTSMTLKVLHDVVQIVMDWFNYHLWEFTIDGRRYGLPMDEDPGDEPPRDATKFRLRDVLKGPTTIIDYLYDFGDNWEHRITVTDIRLGEPDGSYPRYIAGAHNAPPEDCGGIPGFYAILEVLADPKHRDHAEVADWLDEYDPETIEELPIEYGLRRIAARRNAARGRLAKAKQLKSSD